MFFNAVPANVLLFAPNPRATCAPALRTTDHLTESPSSTSLTHFYLTFIRSLKPGETGEVGVFHVVAVIEENK